MASLEQTSSITLQNTRISYSEAGKGEQVLCLHGNPGCKSIFSELMTKLEGTGIKLLAPDRPGHNSSEELLGDKKDLWHDTSVYSELIDARLGGKSWVMGHSYGCLTALKLAIKHPDKVKGLVLINPYIVPDEPGASCSWIPTLAKGAFMGTIFGVLLPNDYQEIFTQYLKGIFEPEKPTDDYLEKWLQRYTRFESIMAYLNDNNTLIKLEAELREELKKLSLPVYALFGGKDGLYELDRQKEAISLIPNVKTETIDEAGHFIVNNNTDLCIKYLSKSILW